MAVTRVRARRCSSDSVAAQKMRVGACSFKASPLHTARVCPCRVETYMMSFAVVFDKSDVVSWYKCIIAYFFSEKIS